MTFDDAATTADQEFNLAQDTNGTIEYATKWVRFIKSRLVIKNIFPW